MPMPDLSLRHRHSFRFKQFEIANRSSAQKVGTDGVLVGAMAWAPSPTEIWDVGAGTGLIGLMLAQRFCDAHITAIELEPMACEECVVNVGRSPWANRISVIPGDIINVADTLNSPDLIVSNPPFFSATGFSAPDSRRNIARHDGTLSPLSLISLGKTYLAVGGRLVFIAPFGRSDEIQLSAELHRMIPVGIVDVASRADKTPKRRVWTMMRREEAVEAYVAPTRLDIHSSALGTAYSAEYRQLTREFYLDF